MYIFSLDYPEETFGTDEKLEEINKKLKHDLVLANNNEDMKYLKDFLRQRIPLSVKNFKLLDPNDTNLISPEELKSVLYNFKLPQRFVTESVIDPLIMEFRDKQDNSKINYKNFIEHLADYKDINDFFNFKDKHIEKLQSKIIENKDIMLQSLATIRKEEEKKHELLHDLEKNIKIHEEEKIKMREKQIQMDLKELNQINNSQPSKEFNEMLFKNKDEHFKKYKEFENNFSAHPSLRKEIKAKTRYGANPELKSSKWITEQDPKSSMYISETERFNNNLLDYQIKEKQTKQNRYNNKIDIIKYYTDQKDNNSTMSVMLRDQKNRYSLIQRTEKMYRYELINKLRNELIE